MPPVSIGVDRHARVVGRLRQGDVLLEAGHRQPLLGEEDQVLLPLEVLQVVDAGVDVAQVLERLGGGRDEVLERQVGEHLRLDLVDVGPCGHVGQAGRLSHLLPCHLFLLLDLRVGLPLHVLLDPLVGGRAGVNPLGREQARPFEHLVDLPLQRLRDQLRAVQGRQAAHLQFDLEVDLLVVLLEPLEDARDLRVIGREGGGAVVGEDRHLVARQQPLAHEAQQRVHGLRRFQELAAAEDDQEDPVLLRIERDRLLLELEFRPRIRRVRHERLEREVLDLLPDAVLDDGELLQPHVGDGLAGLVVQHPDVDRHEGDGAAEGRQRLLRLLLSAGSHSGVQRHGQSGERRDEGGCSHAHRVSPVPCQILPRTGRAAVHFPGAACPRPAALVYHPDIFQGTDRHE